MRTILVIDDDHDIVETVSDACRIEGIFAVGVGDLNQVETIARQIIPDVILIDLMLQGTCGVEMAQELRDGGFDTPLVAMTGSHYLAEVARETGLFEDVLNKPFDLDTLLMTLSESAAA